MIGFRKVFFSVASTFILSISLLGLSPSVEARARQTKPIEKTSQQGFLSTELNQRNAAFERYNTGDESDMPHHTRAIGLEKLHAANVKAHREYIAHIKIQGQETTDYSAALSSYEGSVKAFHHQFIEQRKADAATGFKKAGIVFKGALDFSFSRENEYAKLLREHIPDLERTRAELESTYTATLPPTEATKIDVSQTKLDK